jgi:nitrite reductase/ring-hydroxylating ferredoxin subunit
VRRVAVAPVAELPPGERKLLEVDGRSIGVFNVGGEFFALRNRCPHQGGPLCIGRTTGLTRGVLRRDAEPDVVWERDGEILRCPWHAWEFDLRTGEAVFGEGWRVATYRAYIGEPDDAVPPPPPGVHEHVPPPVETYPTSVEGEVVYVEVPAR